MKQKIIRVGNSAAITIPKEVMETLGLRVGTKAVVTVQPEIRRLVVDIAPKKLHGVSAKLSQEFTAWLNSFLKEDTELIKELAKR